ncbi:MAG: hypothetical protein KAW51_10945, partial [Candidatus Lokiarchaeota archaeon]|nr:hypothetical protein [Candidatus Lokiarchaeota archaeon]
SYRIKFEGGVLFLEGLCPNGHRQPILINNYNRDWVIHQKKLYRTIDEDYDFIKIYQKENFEEIIREFIDVIPTNYCQICNLDYLNIENGRTEEEIERERIEFLKLDAEQFEAEIIRKNKEIDEADDLMEIIHTISSINKEDLLYSLDKDLLKRKIIKFSKDISNKEILNILYNSKNFINIQQVRTLIKENIEEATKENEKFVKDLILSLISDELTREDGDIYYNYFEYDDLNEFLITFQPEFDLQEILKLTDYFIGKVNYCKTKGRLSTPRKIFFFNKQQFIKLFYKILKSPEKFVNELKIIYRKNELIDNLHSLAQPFSFYARCIKDQKLKYLMEKRRSSEYKEI